MDNKTQLLQLLKERCEQQTIEENECFSASSLSDACHISRNTASQYLNEFVKQMLIVKVNSRPVYFFAKETLEKKLGIELTETSYDSFDDLLSASQKDFEKLIGHDGSLRALISRCQAAVAYPDHGLPILIHGATGTGKSLIANLMYEYGINQGILQKDARFIALNCSEYANNPELLTANLFGHVKGAYTGADSDQPRTHPAGGQRRALSG